MKTLSIFNKINLVILLKKLVLSMALTDEGMKRQTP